MKKYWIIAIALLFIITACSKVPVTGRRQMNLLPESTLMSMSLTSYNQFLKENKTVKSGGDAQRVKRVGSKIASAVNAYLKQKKLIKRVKGYKWEFNLVDDDQANAWAMPGGKVVVYSGILPITKDDKGLAVVMGHEVAHAIARHGNERVSQQLGVQLGGIGLAVAIKDKPAQTQEIFNQAYGYGTSVGLMLPFSRKHESEADQMGLVFMAMAGYDPREAPKFWQRMSKQGGQQPPEFLSTHPSHATRVKDLNDYMPKALKYYKKK